MANRLRTLPDTWQLDTTNALAKLEQLPVNWDGHGSPPIKQAALQAASRLISSIDREDLGSPKVYPVTGGGIGLTWQKRLRELEIEILPAGSIQCLCVETNAQTGQETTWEYHLPSPEALNPPLSALPPGSATPGRSAP